MDPLSPDFTGNLVRQTARIMANMDHVMRPGGIATDEGLSAALQSGMQHLAAHQGDVVAALASVKAAGAVGYNSASVYGYVDPTLLTSEGLAAAPRATNAYIDAHNGDTHATLAAVKSVYMAADRGSGHFIEASDEPSELPIQVFPPINEEELKNLEKEGVSPIVAREIAEADAAASMAIGGGPPKASGNPAGPSGARGFAGNKSAQKWQNQLRQRGWTQEQIEEAIANGQSYPAQNRINPGNGATRYVNPQTGQSVVIDNKTGEILHVGGPGFKY